MATQATDSLVRAVLQWTPLQVSRELWALVQDVTGGSRSHKNCMVELARMGALPRRR